MNPYIQGNITKLKVLLPGERKKAWQLVGTPQGMGKWFPLECLGKIAKGETIEFIWVAGAPEKFKVLDVKENESWEMEWVEGAKVKYHLESESPVIFSLEVSYPDNEQGKATQLIEVAGWTFYLANLKSVVMGGPDLRRKNSSYGWKEGFIDG
ncbi:MAG: hypothetical protein RBG1_1C00001G1081 [candidate division Zixibacteria bacterium RBG-1]|nr:MAG: hypothetical protein RBG1_1C00001G1081 [candidate division Zixibacteria bacterium RBG-1]OGC83196.1 MAG: hypothetical protein A2V73_06765 [candidate division Zixibacteria bacterium RBG_19FT_COMBO_42_43]